LRLYLNFHDALNELKRDVNELGTLVHPQTMQDKDIADDPEYLTKEYLNQTYAVTRPQLDDLNPSQPWADLEFEERIQGLGDGEGEAWKSRPEVWQEFHDRGFGYTYGERYDRSLAQVLAELDTHPESRQIFLSVWASDIDPSRFGKIRVPCSLGYWIAIRGRRVQLTYLQRSADLITHFENDVYLSHKLQCWLAEQLGLGVGTYTHWIGSLHAYQKDVAGVF
jgi:thymidylate synthase